MTYGRLHRHTDGNWWQRPLAVDGPRSLTMLPGKKQPRDAFEPYPRTTRWLNLTFAVHRTRTVEFMVNPRGATAG